MRTFAYGTDASFYRLNPKLVVKVHSEAEIQRILPIATRLGVPVTFRAAGTSLSGQAITDSVLLKLSHTGKNFRDYTIHVSSFSNHSSSTPFVSHTTVREVAKYLTNCGLSFVQKPVRTASVLNAAG